MLGCTICYLKNCVSTVAVNRWREIQRYVKATTGNGTCAAGLPLATSAATKRPRLSTSEGDVSRKVHWSSEKIEPSTRHYSSSTEPCGDETDAEEEVNTLIKKFLISRDYVCRQAEP